MSGPVKPPAKAERQPFGAGRWIHRVEGSRWGVTITLESRAALTPATLELVRFTADDLACAVAPAVCERCAAPCDAVEVLDVPVSLAEPDAAVDPETGLVPTAVCGDCLDDLRCAMGAESDPYAEVGMRRSDFL